MREIVRGLKAALASVAVAAAVPTFAVALLSVEARAQGTGLRAPPAPGFAAIAGVVDDSLRGGPLVGASVVVIGTSLRTTTDRGGFFRIDSIPPGEATLVVMHPLLDTLSLTITTPRFPVLAGRLEEIGLSTPAMALFRDRLCPRSASPYRNGVLAGRVDEADKDGPITNAVVSLVYVDPAAGSPMQRVRTVRTRDDGMYVICGLPETIVGTVQAAVGTVSSSEVAVITKDQPLATTSFILSTGPRAADRVITGNAVLTGRVTNVAGTPIKEAQVAVEGGTVVGVTGEDGMFTLRGLPSGTTSAVIRKIGFAPAMRTVHLRAAEPIRLSVALSEGARSLPTVTVTGKLEMALKKVGFSDRKNFGARSAFLGPEDIAKQNPRQPSDLFRMMPGFKVRASGMGSIVEASRTSGSELAGCVNIFVDRTPFQQMTPGDFDNAFPISMIGAVEGYASAAETPAEFRMGGRSCATIVAWTKMKLSSP